MELKYSKVLGLFERRVKMLITHRYAMFRMHAKMFRETKQGK